MFEWHPNPGPQELFHKSPAFEVLYGGAAGGGKSESLLVEALRYAHVPGYTAILFRRTFPELSQPRGLIDRSREICPLLGGTYNKQEHQWTFPAGSTLTFSHMEHADDKYAFQSAEFAYAGFDELTSFLEEQYIYIFSRIRTKAVDPNTGQAVVARIRAASNPGNEGHDWVKQRWLPWLTTDPEAPSKANPGELRWFKLIRTPGTDEEIDTEVPRGTPFALSRQFIPANLYDNPKLMEADPEYEARLMALPLIERERLLRGNWDIVIKGNLFKPEWFKYLDRKPEGYVWARYWDLAASIKTKADFSASPASTLTKEGDMIIADMINMKAEWPIVRKQIVRLIEEEEHVKRIGIEKKLHGIAALQDLQADKDVTLALSSHGAKLEGIDVDTDKYSRALAWSDRAEQGRVYLVRGPWNAAFVSQAALFDGTGATHDDMVDGVSGTTRMVTKRIWRKSKFLHL